MFAVAYCVFVSVWACFPSTVESTNFAPAVWCVVVVGAAAVYWVFGRRWYTPPVMMVEAGRKGLNLVLELEGAE